MDENEAYSSPIAAESVGETRATPAPNTHEHAVRPVATSAGPQARIAEKTAESVGERAGDAYADATTEQARDRSRNFIQRSRASGGGSIYPWFDEGTLVTAVAAFALGYAIAFLIHRSTS